MRFSVPSEHHARRHQQIGVGRAQVVLVFEAESGIGCLSPVALLCFASGVGAMI
jgi:hypothetical protein